MPKREIRTEEWAGAGAEILQGMGFLFSWNAELTTFYARRFQQYWSLPFRLAQCVRPEDVQSLQEDFLQRLAADYRNEAARLSRIVSGPGEASPASTDAAEAAYAARLNDAQRDAAMIIEQAKAQAERIVESAEKRTARPTRTRKTQTRKRA